jgi:hypothetical protein
MATNRDRKTGDSLLPYEVRDARLQRRDDLVVRL